MKTIAIILLLAISTGCETFNQVSDGIFRDAEAATSTTNGPAQ